MIEDILLPFVSERFASEPSYRTGHIRIVNPLPGTVVLGLHLPDMKRIAKGLAVSEECPRLLDRFESSAGPGAGLQAAVPGAASLFYEEMMIWGLMLDYMKVPLGERLERFGRFVPHIDNWAVCDTVCAAAKWVAARSAADGIRRTVWDFLSGWSASSREFEVRFAIIMYMSYFLDEKWLPDVFSVIDGIDFGRISSEYVSLSAKKRGMASKTGKESWDRPEILVSGPGYTVGGPRAGTVLGEPPYYVRMAVAWLLATALARFPDLTREYVRKSSLPEDVLRLYARKARESFRTRTVSPF